MVTLRADLMADLYATAKRTGPEVEHMHFTEEEDGRGWSDAQAIAATGSGEGERQKKLKSQKQYNYTRLYRRNTNWETLCVRGASLIHFWRFFFSEFVFWAHRMCVLLREKTVSAIILMTYQVFSQVYRQIACSARRNAWRTAESA